MDVKLSAEALRLFNEKADKLEGLSFTKKLFDQESGVTISGKLGEPVEAHRHGPDDESIDAFVLTLRFFIQDNETTSFRNIADLYSGLPVSRDLVTKFTDARNKTNAFLDSPTPVKLNNTDLTYRRVFEIFMWGGLAHANPKSKVVYDSWVRNPILFPLLQNEFIVALVSILNVVFFTRSVNKAALGQLPPQH